MGGLLVTFKGSGIYHEIANSQGVMEDMGFQIETKVAYRLPETRGERHLLVLRRQH